MDAFKNFLQNGYNAVMERFSGSSGQKPQVQQASTTPPSSAAESDTMTPDDTTSFASASSEATYDDSTSSTVDVKTSCGPITGQTVRPDQLRTKSSHLAVISMRGAADTKARVPLDVVCVIEASERGSMCGRRLEMVRHALRFIISVLDQDDRLSIVTFSDGGNVDFPLTRMDAAGQGTAQSIVSEIESGGSTNIEAGLTTGFGELLRAGRTPQGLRHTAAVLLLNTGQPCVGMTAVADLVSLVQTKVASIKRHHGCACSMHTFGLGGHNVSLLDGLEKAGVGKQYDLGLLGGEITPSFADCLAGLMR